MKNSFLILLITLGSVLKINAQLSYQKFESAGFNVKSNCTFTFPTGASNKSYNISKREKILFNSGWNQT
jgi:hypothetical protein